MGTYKKFNNFVLQNSATYWEGKADMESLQRIYGISFPDPKQLKEWQKLQEEAAKRDHRKIGRVCNFLLMFVICLTSLTFIISVNLWVLFQIYFCI